MKKTLALFLVMVAICVVVLSLGGICYAEEVVDLAEETTTKGWFETMWATYGGNLIDALSGISLGTILSAIAVAIIKKETTKVANKVDDTKTINKLTYGVIDGIKDTKIDLSIQPIVKYEIAKAVEIANIDIIKKEEKLEKILCAIVEIQEAQAKYFDASTMIGDDAKADLQHKVDYAKSLFDKKQEIATITIETETKVEEKETTIENY